tara:strand:- start:1207 stop:1347 length:141 start_codon:yes stop_codon:yes gene_type:complete
MTNETFIDEIRMIAFGTKDPTFCSLNEVVEEILQRSNEHYSLTEED